ncbi:hypothetical protein J7K99_02780 [bacterium]|nr:hypothetical protein [bacterium]
MSTKKEVYMNDAVEKLIEIGGIPLMLLILGYLAGRYIKPWIHRSSERLARAQEIALIADRITDEMLLMFPDQRWDDWLDKAVDKLIKACGLQDAGLERREILSQVAKKVGENVPKE